jgi:biopolymer transport protein TolR
MNVVPYIDVMLVLLVIFMITAPLISQGVKVELPHTTEQTLPLNQQNPLIVTIDRRGYYYLSTERELVPLMLSQLTTQVVRELSHHKQTWSVLIRGDRQVAYGKIVAVMVALKSAGIGKVGLVTDHQDNAHV